MISVSSRPDLPRQSLIDPIHHLGQVPAKGRASAEFARAKSRSVYLHVDADGAAVPQAALVSHPRRQAFTVKLSSMTPERWGQLEELYQAARALPPSERTALLERADPELRAEVASILAQEGPGKRRVPRSSSVGGSREPSETGRSCHRTRACY